MMLIENLLMYCKKPYEKDGKTIYPSFPIPKESEQYMAERWSGYHTNSESSMINFSENGDKFPIFTNVTIDSLDVRGNGGRAYKVIVPYKDKNFLVDLREDTLLDVIREKGIEAGGKLNGEFAFVRHGSQTYLILCGTDKYLTHLEQAMKKQKSKKISNKDLKVGYEYSTEKGEPYVYLGAYYQHENLSTPVISRIGDKPLLHHAFYQPNMEKIVFRKSHVFSVESDLPVMDLETTKEIMFKYTQDAYKSFLQNLSDIQNCYVKFYEHHQRTQNYTKEYYVKRAKDEVQRLSCLAHENYRQYATSMNKEDSNYDQYFVRTMVSKSKTEAVENVRKHDFFIEKLLTYK